MKFRFETLMDFKIKRLLNLTTNKLTLTQIFKTTTNFFRNQETLNVKPAKI